ncbi:MAG TPA: GNAT family N-acetyltransferase [Lacibacter sp.]|nr:GNAT family N-acetyltransferase [Lacibacter sp.]
MEKQNAIVKLRPWIENDLAPLVSLANNKEIYDQVRDLFPHPYTLEDGKYWLSVNVGITPVLNFVIEVDGQFAGSIGMVPQTDVYRCNMEIGYWLGQAFWGNGVATKAVELIVNLIWHQYPHVQRIYANTYESNEASQQVLRKNDFILECVHKKGVIKNNKLLDEYVWVKFRDQ